MEKINLSTAMKNLLKSLPLIISTVAALCLFLSPSLTSILMLAVVFFAVLAATLLGRAKPTAFSGKLFRLTAAIMAILIALTGYDTFRSIWAQSGKVEDLAKALHTTKPALLLIVGAVGCVVGYYAMYTLSCRIVKWIRRVLKENLHEQKKEVIAANLKRNWYFPISAVAAFCLFATLTVSFFVGLVIAFVFALIVASQVASIRKTAFENSLLLCVFSALCAIGICLVARENFCSYWGTADKIFYISIFGAVNAVYFIYCCILVFWKRMAKIFSENRTFAGIGIAEYIVYAILIITSIALMIATFSQTQAFYGTEHSFDIIYTADSPSLVKGDVYLALAHAENDLRQPLFAVFAAPFAGIAYLIGGVLGASASVQAMLLNTVQILMLFAANFMLAKMISKSPVKRICLMLLMSCTYTQMLFTLMMEQYIVAYFWLVFCMYLIAEKRRPDRLVMWGAGGTLLTSMILLPFMSEKNPVMDFKKWLSDMVKYGLEFVAFMLAFCRFDVISNLTTEASSLEQFTGKAVTFADKIYQYTGFVSSCFVAPDAGVRPNAFDEISWQLNSVTGISLAGVIILILAIVSAALNRNKRSSLLSCGWIAFSVVMLLVLGWGTAENGLILYSLYFGWAFLVLLFQLIEKLENKLKVRFITPVFSVAIAALLAAINIPEIMKMIDFAITHFPT